MRSLCSEGRDYSCLCFWPWDYSACNFFFPWPWQLLREFLLTHHPLRTKGDAHVHTTALLYTLLWASSLWILVTQTPWTLFPPCFDNFARNFIGSNMEHIEDPLCTVSFPHGCFYSSVCCTQEVSVSPNYYASPYIYHSQFVFLCSGYIYLWMPCSVQGSVLVTDILKFSHMPIRAEWYSDVENLHVANYKNQVQSSFLMVTSFSSRVPASAM